MLLGSDALGRMAIGQIASSRKGTASGVVIEVSMQLRPGAASGDSGVRRFAGGAATVRAPRVRHGWARGALIVVEASIVPGIATGDTPRLMTKEEAVAHDNEFLLLFA